MKYPISKTIKLPETNTKPLTKAQQKLSAKVQPIEGERFPFGKLEVGHSFAAKDRSKASMNGPMWRAELSYGRKFVSREMTNGGVRVFRVA